MNRVYLLTYSNLNFGDDLFVYVICKRYPKVRFYMLTDLMYKGKLRDIANLKLFIRPADTRLTALFSRLLGMLSNAIVYIGGSIFWEEPYWSTCYNATNCKKKFVEFTRNAYNLRRPFFVLGCKFENYRTDNFLKFCRSMFSRFEEVCFRDQYSYQLFGDLPNVRYAPDIVFGFDYDKYLKDKKVSAEIVISVWGLMEPQANDNSKRFKANGHFHNLNYKAYRDKMVEIVKYYLAKGKKVTLVSFCESRGDLLCCKRIVGKLTQSEREKVDIINYDGNISHIIALFYNADMIISTRYHAMIIGWLMNKVVFPIVYCKKAQNVIDDIGFQGKSVHYENIATLKMEDIDYNYIKQVIPDVTEIKKNAKKQFLKLDQLFLNKREKDKI